MTKVNTIMNNEIRDNLIIAIRESIPEGTNLTNYLSDTLNIGRESAYRRIRGEINFTFEEVTALSKDLGFSIDNIIGIKRNENALFNIHMLQDMEYIDIYTKTMLDYGHMFREMDRLTNVKARIAANTLPYFFHINYGQLSKFRIYKWLYQNQKISVHDKFADFVLPEKVLNAHALFCKDLQRIQHMTVILDNNVFWSVTKDIEYFFKKGSLSSEDVQVLKTEMHRLVNELELMATTGVNKSGTKVEMYISSVYLEATYMHCENANSQFSQVRIFSISAIDSYNVGLCKIQKDWIESLKRYSVLVSESGEMQRLEYMQNQRKYIDLITNFSDKV